MAYTIRLSEAQRAMLVEALNEADVVTARWATLTEATDPLEHENVTWLHAALSLLPENEAESPGTLHGLCL